MKRQLTENHTYLLLGVLGVIIFGLAGADKFPYLETSPFGFSLPNYAAY